MKTLTWYEMLAEADRLEQLALSLRKQAAAIAPTTSNGVSVGPVAFLTEVVSAGIAPLDLRFAHNDDTSTDRGRA